LRLKNYILVAAAIIGILSIFYMGYILKSVREQAISTFSSVQMTLSRGAAIGIERYTDRIMKDLRYTARNYPELYKNPQERRKALKMLWDMGEGEYISCSFVNRDGILVATYPPEYSSVEGTDISYQTHIKEIKREHSPTVSDPIKAVQGFQAIIFHNPIFTADSNFEGSIAALIPFETISRKFITAMYKRGIQSILILNQRGVVIEAPDTQMIGKLYKNSHLFQSIADKDKPFLEAALKGASGTAVISDTTGHKFIVACNPIKINKHLWEVFAISSQDIALAPIKKITYYGTGWLVTLLAIYFIISLVIIELYKHISITEERAKIISLLEEEVSARTESLSKMTGFLNNILENSIEYGIISINQEGQIVIWNRGMENITGYSKEDITETRSSAAVSDSRENFQKLWEITNSVSEKHQPWKGEYELVAKSGENLICDITVSNITDSEGKEHGILVLMRNVTQEKRLAKQIKQYTENLERLVAERTMELTESEEKYRALFEKAQTGFFVHTNGIIEAANPAICEMTGVDADTAIGMSIFDFIPYEEDREKVKEGMQKRLSGEPVSTYTIRIRKTTGEFFYGSVSASVISPADKRFLVNVIDVSRDVELENERKRTQEQLWQASKLASIGELAAGIAHEINNPLMGIINYAQLIADDLTENSDARQFVNGIISEGEQIASTIRNLLIFARQEKQEFSPEEITDVIESSLALVEHQLKKDGITIIREFQSNLPTVNIKSNRIKEVFVNILSNARYALNEKYPLSDENKIIKIHTDTIVENGEKKIRVQFYDSGIGIKKEDIPKLFDPFFTTKKGDQGTGLGLSISYGIIKEHRGNIEVESVYGVYTVVTVTLPVEE